MPFRPSKWVIYAPVAVLPVLAAIVLESRDLQEGIARRATDNLVAAGAGMHVLVTPARCSSCAD